jgi:hypothetical protein
LRLPIRWKLRHACHPADIRQSRFRAVLLAALNTRFYGPLLESVALGTREEVAALSSIDDALARLPSVDPLASGLRFSACMNPHEAGSRRPELFWPLPPAARTAVLMDGFRQRDGVKVFRQVQRPELSRYAPEALAGPVSELRGLAEAIEDRGVRMPRLTHSVIAFAVLRQGFLSDEARELFWRVFKVPVFGQIVSPGGGLLAWECEAHEGFHIDGERAVFETEFGGGEPELLVTSLVDLRQPVIRLATGLTARMEHSTCGCGQMGPRLMELRRRPLPKATLAAASAACAAD